MKSKLKALFKRDSGLLDIRTVQKYIETVTNNAGLNVRFDPDAPAPCTNKNTLIIPAFNENATQEDLKKLRWWVLHESLHHTKGPESFEIGDKELGFDARHSPLAAIWNIYEDERIEKAGAKDYRGDRQIIDDGWRTLMQGQQGKDLEHVLKNAGEEMQKVGAAWYLNVKARSKWSPAAIEQEVFFDKHMKQETRDYVKKLEDAGVLEELEGLREDKGGSRDSFDLAKRTYELLWEESADKHIKETQDARKKEQQQGKSGKGDSEGDGEAGEQDGDDSQGGESGGEGTGDGKEGKGRSKAKGKLGNPNQKGEPCKVPSGGTVSYEVFVHSEHTDPKAPGGTGITIDYSEHRKKGYNNDYIPCDTVKWARYRNNTYSGPEIMRHEQAHDYQREQYVRHIRQHHATHGVPGKGFGNKIRQLLQIKSQAHYQGGKKQGKLHFKNVYKAGTHIPSYEERVFRQKTTSDTLDTCVTVLTDLSGSMAGPKFLNAVDSSILLNTSIAQSLRIPVEILGFSEYGHNTFIGVVKEFSEQTNEETIIENFCRASCFMSANADGDAILWAYDRLKQQKQKRKILIVISDGQPAASRSGDAYGFTKKVVAQIEGEGLVEIYAIGIMSEEVKHIYSESVVIQRPTELEAAVLNLIKRSIFKN